MMAGIVAGGRAVAAAQGASDPYWSNVVSLLHFNGANNSTTFTDQKGKTWSTLGSPVIKTDHSLFGGSSGYFIASTIESSASSDWAFGTGDFTVELWVRANDLGTGGFYDSPIGNWSSSAGWCFFIRPDGTLQFTVNTAAVVSSPGVISVNVGTRISASRVAGTLRLFVNGAQVGSVSDTTNLTRTDSIRIGGNRVGASDDHEGYIDEVRITKGIGRYSGSYVLADSPFPDQ